MPRDLVRACTSNRALSMNSSAFALTRSSCSLCAMDSVDRDFFECGVLLELARASASDSSDGLVLLFKAAQDVLLQHAQMRSSSHVVAELSYVVISPAARDAVGVRAALSTLEHLLLPGGPNQPVSASAIARVGLGDTLTVCAQVLLAASGRLDLVQSFETQFLTEVTISHVLAMAATTAANNHWQLAEQLAEAKFNALGAGKPMSYGEFALFKVMIFAAIDEGQADFLRPLISVTSPRVSPSDLKTTHETSLLHAADLGNVDVVTALCDAFPRRSAPTSHAQAFEVASTKGHLDVVDALVRFLSCSCGGNKGSSAYVQALELPILEDDRAAIEHDAVLPCACLDFCQEEGNSRIRIMLLRYAHDMRAFILHGHSERVEQLTRVFVKVGWRWDIGFLYSCCFLAMSQELRVLEVLLKAVDRERAYIGAHDVFCGVPWVTTIPWLGLQKFARARGRLDLAAVLDGWITKLGDSPLGIVA